MLLGIVTARAEELPCRPRGRYAVDADGLREIIAAADGDNEGWDLLQRQPAKMAMDGSIPPENQRRVGLVCGIQFVARKKIDARHLELPDVVIVDVKSQQGNSAHGATFAQVR